MSDTYILKGHTAVKADTLEWARWFETADKPRRVARTKIGNAEVSTVFLGLDHEYRPGYPPLIFETMVFWSGSPLDNEGDRYSTWEQAEAGHAAMCEKVRLYRSCGLEDVADAEAS